MHTALATQKALQCADCGGQCVFSPVDRALKCQSCGNTHPVIHDGTEDPSRELHYHPDTAHTEQPEFDGTRMHSCETCGGAVVFTGPALSERCPYCDGPVVLGDLDESYEILGLMPFEIDMETAQLRAEDWIASRYAAPSDLAAHVGKARVAGLYAPFWTFDSHEAVDYFARYKERSGKKTYTRSTEGEFSMRFDDLLMPASHHVTPLIRDGILHEFKPRSLRPYDPGYLSGFAAERHHQTVTQGLEANRKDKDLLIRNRIKQVVNESGVHDIRYKTHTTGIRYRRVLLPVWILHYRYADVPYKVVVCGHRGRSFGERPFSRWKLAGYSALAAAATVAFGWAWGAVAGL